MFFSDDNGHFYRAQTSLANFPNGFGNTRMVMSDTKNNLFEATNVYKVAGSNQYLLLQEAINNTTWRRYFKAFTATSLTGDWTPLVDPKADGDYLTKPWRMGLLTQTNSPC
ncbi:non-reducing end alpha-L-arabinofuranosidase family hydrolase [Streptomyces sp. NPDC007991]|uniref:non-reducing end alpha-L-arabinofuranosidase family hydrolase n=1 Tax=Streptomyces sp. NPDC007991 TaxID=3364803 RepID=UPI0036E5C75C